MRYTICALATALAAMVMASSVSGASSFLSPGYPGYGDIYLNGGADTANGNFDVLSDGSIIAQTTDWSGTWEVNLYSSQGAYLRTLTSWSDAGYGSFVRVDPSESTVWFGKTNTGPDDYIRKVSLAANNAAYTDVAILAGNMDLEFAQVGGVWTPFVSGLNKPWSGSTNDINGIWRLDDSGNNKHDLIVKLGGNSAGFAFNAAGTLYGYSQGASGIVDYAAANWLGQIDADPAVSDSWITASVIDLLTATESGLGDATVDDVGNLIFDVNGAASRICLIETGKDYSAYGSLKYDVLATGTGAWGNWFGGLAANGDVTAGGRAFVSDAWYSVPIGYVPEPGCISVLMIAAALVRRRNR